MKAFHALAIAISLPALAACNNQPVARQNEPAPELAAVDAANRVVKISDLHGKVVLINFWLSGCGPCLAEMPELDKVYRAYKGRGFEILAVNYGQDKYAIEDAARRTAVSYPLLVDPLNIARTRYNVIGAPTSFLIDPQGVIRERIDGQLSGKALEERIARLLQSPTRAVRPAHPF